MRFKWPHEAAHVGDGTSLMRGQLGEGRNRKTWEKMMGPAHESRPVPLALPTLVSLALFQFAPMVVDSASGYLHFPYCYPDIASQAGDSVYFAGLLLIMTVLSLAASFAPFAKGKDVLL